MNRDRHIIRTAAALTAAGFLLTQCGNSNRDFDPSMVAGAAGEIASVAGGAGLSVGGGSAGAPAAHAGSGQGGDESPNSGGSAGDSSEQAGGSSAAGKGQAGTPGSSAGSGGSPSGGSSSGGSSGSPTAGASSGGSAGAGSCAGGCADGTVCSAANQCKSGRCVDGVCCNGPCDDTCQACSSALTGAADGICTSVKKGTDPHDTCATAAASTCGTTGVCGSNGVCALYDSTTTCKAASCASGSAKSAQTCDGAGTCKAATSSACSPYVCGATACLTSCSANSQCVSGQVCVSNGCKAPSDLLGPCDELTDCNAGTCIGGVCALTIVSVEVYGSAVSGGGSYSHLDGWFTTDSSGKNPVQQGTFSLQSTLWAQIDVVTQFPTPIAPNSYLVFGGANEGSNPLTRNFQFNLSDGSSITKAVQASSSINILYNPVATDLFTMFQWTGATVNVLSKTY
ncbi:MAG: hypothetical protein ABUL62_15535 [Myxococcales bacterium]